jgi:hypothetical protein
MPGASRVWILRDNTPPDAMKSDDQFRGIRRRWLAGGICAALAALTGLFLTTGFGNGLTQASFDFPFAVRVLVFRKLLSTDEVRMVFLDEASQQALNQPPHSAIGQHQNDSCSQRRAIGAPPPTQAQ